MEKLLTNWLSLCMYDYLKKHVARAMFMLYRAIKHQTEKGPVDGVTSDARYALSEDRLLRENTECRPLVCLLWTLQSASALVIFEKNLITFLSSHNTNNPVFPTLIQFYAA